MRSPEELANVIKAAFSGEDQVKLMEAYEALGELRARAEGDPGPTLKDIDQILGGPVGKRIFEME